MRRFGGPLRRAIDLLRGTPLHPQWLYVEPKRHLPEIERLPAGGCLLDVGSGEGWLRQRLGDRMEYFAIDHPVTGGQWYGAKPDVFGDSSALPFASGSMQAVVALEVLEHVPRFEETLREIDRVCSNGGHVLCSVPFLYPVHDAPSDYRRLTVFGLRAMGEDMGWALESIRPLAPGLRGVAVVFGVSTAAALRDWHRASFIGRAAACLSMALVPLVNVACWALSSCLPDDGRSAGGHVAMFRKVAAGKP